MSSPPRDRFLLAILAGIAALVLLSLGLFFARQGTDPYVSDDSPRGVLQNYATAILRGDLERAFSYVAGPPSISTTAYPYLPDYTRFQRFFLTEANNQLPNNGLLIGEERLSGDAASVTVTNVYSSGDPFSSGSRNFQQVELVRQKGAWKITNGPYPYWSYEWSNGPKYAPAIPAP